MLRSSVILVALYPIEYTIMNESMKVLLSSHASTLTIQRNHPSYHTMSRNTCSRNMYLVSVTCSCKSWQVACVKIVLVPFKLLQAGEYTLHFKICSAHLFFNHTSQNFWSTIYTLILNKLFSSQNFWRGG